LGDEQFHAAGGLVDVHNTQYFFLITNSDPEAPKHKNLTMFLVPLDSALEGHEVVAHRTDEGAHGLYRCTGVSTERTISLMQLLLVRHALPHRTEAGEGADPELSGEGWQQAARLPEALARFPITRLVSSPQRRAIQTAEPVAHARELILYIDERLAEYDRGLSHYVPIEQVRTERPEEWARMAQGRLPSSVDEDEFRGRVGAALADIVAAAGHDDTVAVFSHGGVINVILHEVLGTKRLLSFPIDYVSITRLLYARNGFGTVAAVNATEHVWDLLPRNQRY
jgi:probable phosphoglycerate mutase